MKLHDPETERNLLRLAIAGRNGKPIAPPDPRPGLWGTFKLSLYILASGAGVSGILGATNPLVRTHHWQTLFGSMILMALAMASFGRIFGTVCPPGTHAVLVNLPINGERVFRWIRFRFFLKSWFLFLTLSLTCSFALQGFADDSLWSTATTGLLLFAVSYSTVILLGDPLLIRLKVTNLWSLLLLILFVGLVLLYGFHQKIFSEGEIPEWLANGILGLAWAFPPSWCMPGHIENGGAWLSAAWIAWGAFRWIKWPRAAGQLFDMPYDFMNTFGDFGLNEDDEEAPQIIFPQAISETSNAEEPRSGLKYPIHLPAPLAMPQSGWLDRWIRRAIGKNNQDLAGAVCDLTRSWSKQTTWLMRLSPFWLISVWALTEFPPFSLRKDDITLFIGIASVILLIGGLLPFSNSIPRALAPWYLGAQKIPFFSALPISSRDLLRISNRITFVRGVAMILIASPVVFILLALLLPGENPWVSLWLVPSLVCFWSTSRPIFVWYRLQAACRKRRGIWLTHISGSILIIPLVIGWLASGAAGVVFGCGLILGKVSGDDAWILPLLAIGGLSLSGLSARAVFELHRWRLRRGHFDWMSAP